MAYLEGSDVEVPALPRSCVLCPRTSGALIRTAEGEEEKQRCCFCCCCWVEWGAFLLVRQRPTDTQATDYLFLSLWRLLALPFEQVFGATSPARYGLPSVGLKIAELSSASPPCRPFGEVSARLRVQLQLNSRLSCQ